MKEIRDNFSGHSEMYRRFRPHYPESLYKKILSRTKGRENYWDCATGNAQVAAALAPNFKKTFATDISENQLSQAPELPNVDYRVCRAEKTPFTDDFFDLITVAQAIHWFDLHAFLAEARRIGRKGATLAVWGYGLLGFGGPEDHIIRHFYEEIVGPFWDGERRHIDARYASLPLPVSNSEDLGDFEILRPMDLKALQGYLTSWSSVQHYIRQQAENPVVPLITRLEEYWPDGGSKIARFPIFGTLGNLV